MADQESKNPPPEPKDGGDNRDEAGGINLAPERPPPWWVELRTALSAVAEEHEQVRLSQRDSGSTSPAEPPNWVELALEGSDGEFAEAVANAMWASKEPTDILADPDVREFVRAQRLIVRDQAAPDDLREGARDFLADVAQAVEHGGDGARTKQSPGQPKRDILKILPLHTRVMLCMEYERIGHSKGAMVAMRALETFLTDTMPMGPNRDDGDGDRMKFSKNDARNLVTKWWIPIKRDFTAKLEDVLFPRRGSSANESMVGNEVATHDRERRLLDLADTYLLTFK